MGSKDKEELHPLREWIALNAPRLNKMDKPFTNDQCVEILKKYNKRLVANTLMNMDNHKPLTKKYVSAYRTALNWCKMETDRNNGNSPIGHDNSDIKL